jgi:spore coat polysaccharide biosynthesis predicted glycosyltransferase SpsG
VITSAKGKDMIRQSRYGALAVHGYGELPPSTLISYTDIAAFFGAGVPGERMAQYATEAMGMGKVVIDCTTPGTFAASGAPVLRGPEDLVGLSLYLQDVVLDNRIEIGRRIQKGEWLRDHDIGALESTLGLTPAPTDAADSAPKTVFFPTNGNGMGHAQRCALIADELPQDSAHCFAAFPSCVDMLRERGFDCMPMVQRSEDHSEAFANDLVNYMRLNRVLNTGDQLVFDGGYVFDSVYRLIAAKQIPAVWIRRGLWQASQVHDTALEREHVFSRVIVPREAFSELNTDYSFGQRVYPVGPVVNQRPVKAADIKARRRALAKHLDHPFDTLVISMLGGGVASDRSAQLQMMCSLMDQRPNCLHLVVVWPGAVVPNGVYGWKNTRLVRTRHALELCQAADLTLSAAGYNSFHELLYAQVPSIFIPQAAPFLDDQEKRAMAAAERGLAVAVLGTELLQLRREVDAFLDYGKADDLRAALSAHDFPATGNAEAADLIAKGLLP